MVPRTDMVTIDKGKDLNAAMELFLASGCSRVPVIGEDADDIFGIVYLKDVAYKLHLEPGVHRPGGGPGPQGPLRPRIQVGGGTAAGTAAANPRIWPSSIDEYGGTAGLVTLEDLIEEIVGEIDDEYDRAKIEIEDLGDGSFVVRAHTAHRRTRRTFRHRASTRTRSTRWAGCWARCSNRVPVLGSHATFEGIEMKVLSLSGRRNRIGKILVRKAAEQTKTGEHIADKDARHHKEQS